MTYTSIYFNRILWITVLKVLLKDEDERRSVYSNKWNLGKNKYGEQLIVNYVLENCRTYKKIKTSLKRKVFYK